MNIELNQTNAKIKQVQDHLAAMRRLLDHLEGKRDSLIREQTDLEGAHDRRKVAVR